MQNKQRAKKSVSNIFFQAQNSSQVSDDPLYLLLMFSTTKKNIITFFNKDLVQSQDFRKLAFYRICTNTNSLIFCFYKSIQIAL